MRRPVGKPAPRRRQSAQHEGKGAPHTLAEEVRHVTYQLIDGKVKAPTLRLAGHDIAISDIAPDIEHFHEQSYFLRYFGLSSQVTFLHDHDPIGDARRTVPVLVKLPKPFGLASILRADALRAMGFMFVSATEFQARKTFAERISDFILSRVGATTSRKGSDTQDPETIIDTRRRGDTVLYTKGYFLSTGTACGTSTPAKVRLPAGRYSFGIGYGGVADYEPYVWTIPTADAHVALKKP